MSRLDLDMENKRKAPRLDCLVPVDGQAGSVFADTQTVDISKTGIGFISPKPLPVDQKIPIELDMGEEEDPILVIAKVTWSKKIEGSESYRIGLIFDETLPGAKSRLNKYFAQN